MKKILICLLLAVSPSLHAEMANASQQTVDWSYSGETGPSKWASLNKEYALCKKGNEQSPINIRTALTNTEAEPVQITVNYHPVNEVVLKTGLFPKIELTEPGGYIEINEEKFNLKQFHFHSPSDHQLNGESYPIELHLVHENEEGQLAVIGLLIKEGEQNRLLSPILNNIHEEDKVSNMVLTLAELFPENRTHYLYDGSLTTPPCTEGVQWIVFEESIEFSKEQIESITKEYSPTNRPIQPIQNRPVLKQNSIKIK